METEKKIERKKVKKIPVALPCPKCGNKPVTWRRIGNKYACGCLKCQIKPTIGDNWPSAIRAWNKEVENYSAIDEFTR